MSERDLALVVRRTIAATPDRLFEAWTTPRLLLMWWGPRGVRCTSAEVDARPGGAYRIGNRLPDGETLYIVGEFREVEPPRRLVYTWALESSPGPAELVTVRFEPREAGTEVIVVHERIADASRRDQHEHGWQGCLDGLAALVAASG